MSVTVYKNTDASAPQISRTAGSFITFCDAVLVSGYGTMSSAGWTKVSASGTYATYRAPSALGSIYMIVSDATDYYSKVRFSDEFEGFDKMIGASWPLVCEGPGLNGTPLEWNIVMKTTAALATSISVRWSLINSSARGFHLWIDAANETAATVLTYGGLYSIVKPITYDSNDGCILTCFKQYPAHWYDLKMDTSYNGAPTYYANHSRWLYKYRNVPWNITKAGFTIWNVNSLTSCGNLGVGQNYNVNPDPVRGDMIVGDVVIYNDGENLALLGTMPGMLNTYSRLAVTQGQAVSGSAPFASSNFETYTAAAGKVLINITDW